MISKGQIDVQLNGLKTLFLVFNGLHVIFLQVQINFLPVGHIHEDVDQLFSRIGEKIRKSGCESLPGKATMLDVVQASMHILSPVGSTYYHTIYLCKLLPPFLFVKLRSPVVWMLYPLCANVKVLRQHVFCNPVNLV